MNAVVIESMTVWRLLYLLWRLASLPRLGNVSKL